MKTFPEFKIVYDTGTDYLDPALSYTVQGWGVMWNVYLSLLGYKHVNGPDGATLVPALAQALPKVSADGLTYSFTLRTGVKYSDGTDVKASDFKYAIKRLFLIDSPGVGFFTNIVGADAFSKTKKGDIAGSRRMTRRARSRSRSHAAGRLREHPRDDLRRADPVGARRRRTSRRLRFRRRART